MSTYKLMLRIIFITKKTKKNNWEDLLHKLDIYLLADRITDKEYEELVSLIKAEMPHEEEPVVEEEVSESSEDNSNKEENNSASDKSDSNSNTDTSDKVTP